MILINTLKQSILLVILLLLVYSPFSWALSIKASTTQGLPPLTVTFSAISTDNTGIPQFSWKTSDNQSYSSPDGRAEFTFFNTGSYTVTLTDANQNKATISILVPEVSAPIPSFTITNAAAGIESTEGSESTASANIAEAPFVALLDASASTSENGKIVNYSWLASDGQTASGIKTSMVFELPGTYSIALTVIDSNIHQATTNQKIVVTENIIEPNKPPQARFTVTPSGETDGNNVEVSFTALFDASESKDLDGYITQYAWTASPPPSTNFPQPLLGIQTSMAFPFTGVYTITLTVTDDKGATAVSHQQISVKKAPVEEVVAAEELVANNAVRRSQLEVFQLIDKSISRGIVDSSEQTLTSGFQVQDSQEYYYIHAYGVQDANNTLVNPRINLLSYPDLNTVDSNSNWNSHRSANEIKNKGLAPTNNEDAAMIVKLTPGWYIVEVKPENDSGLGILIIKQIIIK